MAYLNADIPPIYCKIRKEYLYDLEKHQGESVDAASLVWSLLQTGLSYLISCYRMVHAFGVYLSQRSFKKNLKEAKSWICQSTNYKYGIALVIILAVHCFSFLRGKREIFW